MQLRRSFALTAVALVLAVPALSSCSTIRGFDVATNEPYTPGAGVNAVEGDVKVLNALIVSGQAESGTFIASLANDSTTETASFEGVSGADGNTIEADDFTAVEIAPRGLVNLATEGGPTISGSFEAGDFVPLTLSFGNGDTVAMKVPVVAACDVYADADQSEPSASSSPTGAYACGEDEEASDEASADEGE
jgi:hypothetical protein